MQGVAGSTRLASSVCASSCTVDVFSYTTFALKSGLL